MSLTKDEDMAHACINCDNTAGMSRNFYPKSGGTPRPKMVCSDACAEEYAEKNKDTIKLAKSN